MIKYIVFSNYDDLISVKSIFDTLEEAELYKRYKILLEYCEALKHNRSDVDTDYYVEEYQIYTIDEKKLNETEMYIINNSGKYSMINCYGHIFKSSNSKEELEIELDKKIKSNPHYITTKVHIEENPYHKLIKKTVDFQI